MVRCNFCGVEVKPGQGKIYAKKDGTTFNFCSNKCEKNLLKLKRVARKFKWTNQYERVSSKKGTKE